MLRRYRPGRVGRLLYTLIQETLGEGLQEGQHKLSLGRRGLLSLRIGPEFANELLAGGYLACRCGLSANALGESKLYLLRTSRAFVDNQRPHEEDNREQGYSRQQNARGSSQQAPSIPIIPNRLPPPARRLRQLFFTLAFYRS